MPETRTWWLFPGQKDPYLEPSVIDQHPSVWQDRVTGARVKMDKWKDFVKVVEVLDTPSANVGESVNNQ